MLLFTLPKKRKRWAEFVLLWNKSRKLPFRAAYTWQQFPHQAAAAASVDPMRWRRVPGPCTESKPVIRRTEKRASVTSESYFIIQANAEPFGRGRRKQRLVGDPLTLRLVPSSAKVSFIVQLSCNMLWCPWMEDMKLAKKIAVNFCENSLGSVQSLYCKRSATGQFVFFSVLEQTWLKCVT